MDLNGIFSLASKKNKNAFLTLAQKLRAKFTFFKIEIFKEGDRSFEGDIVTKSNTSFGSFRVLKVESVLKYREEVEKFSKENRYLKGR